MKPIVVVAMSILVIPRASAWADGLPVIQAMTFNIRLSRANDGMNRWEQRREWVAAVISASGADFVGTQECWPEQTAYLQSRLGQYGHLGRSREVDPQEGESTPLWYRKDRWRLDPREHGVFWLSETPEVPGSRSWWSFCPRTVTWARLLAHKGGGAVYVINTHFDHFSESARRQGAGLLKRWIGQRKFRDDPVIVMGDFNAGESSRTVRLLAGESPDSRSALVDTFRRAHPQEREIGTFHGFSGGKLGNKIDYILASPSVEVLDSQILRENRGDRYPSDHFPVTARLRFCDPPAHRPEHPSVHTGRLGAPAG